MHDIDRTHPRYAQEMGNYPLAAEAPALSEAEEMQLAAALMEVQSEEEFENFLDDLIGGIAKAAGGFLNSPTGKALGGLLKGAAKKLLPVAGTAVGGYFGGPAGASLGGNIASTLAGSLEMERDEMEWESAKTFVRLAADATKTAALTPPGETPEDTARKAVTDLDKRSSQVGSEKRFLREQFGIEVVARSSADSDQSQIGRKQRLIEGTVANVVMGLRNLKPGQQFNHCGHP